MSKAKEFYMKGLVDAYIETGDWVDAKEAARLCGVSVGVFRRRVNEYLGGDLVAQQDARPSYSRDYPGMQTGSYHKLWVYAPSRRALRERLLEYERRLAELDA